MPLFDRGKTFRPMKTPEQGTVYFKIHKPSTESLSAGDLRKAVKCPEGEDVNEWLAVHVMEFQNTVSLVFGTISEFCSKDACPVMNAGKKFEYRWAGKDKKLLTVSAPEYVTLLFDWIDAQLEDESLFPEDGKNFPKNFRNIVKSIMRRIFRVYAHIYYAHYTRCIELELDVHLNTCFKHLFFFVHEFELVEKREFEPLKDLIEELTGQTV